MCLSGVSFDVRRWFRCYRQERADRVVREDRPDLELQAAYEEAFKRAEIELAYLLPPTTACPPEERR